MSRSGYIDDYDGKWELIRWRGAVKSAIRGKRGQAFLREMLTALDALSEKRLIAADLEREGEVCAIGAVGRKREIAMADIDPEDHERIASVFKIAHAMACEIMWINDEAVWRPETPAQRFERVYRWIVENIKHPDATTG